MLSTWPIFIAAPFICPSWRTSWSARSIARRSLAAVAFSSERTLLATFVAVHFTPWPPTSDPNRAVRARRLFGTLVVFSSSGMRGWYGRPGDAHGIDGAPAPIAPVRCAGAARRRQPAARRRRAVAALPRVLRAARRASRARTGARSTRCSARRTCCCRRPTATPRARSSCASAPRPRAYRVAAFPAYHADRPPMPEELEHQWSDARDFFGAFGWTSLEAESEGLEADDLLGSLAQRRDRRGRPHAALHRRPRHVPVRRRARARALPGEGRAGRDRPRRGARALRDRPGAGARPDRAARRPVGRAPRREGDRREGRRRPAEPVRHARGRARAPRPTRRAT